MIIKDFKEFKDLKDLKDFKRFQKLWKYFSRGHGSENIIFNLVYKSAQCYAYGKLINI